LEKVDTHSNKPPVKNHYDYDDPLGNIEIDSKKDSLHNNPVTKRIEGPQGHSHDYRPSLKGVPSGVEVIIRSDIHESTHYIVLEGANTLLQNITSHLKSTGEWTVVGNNTMINQKQVPLQKLYQYLMRQIHKCKIGKIKWNYGIDGAYKQIEEIQLWA